jgi:hypothetical protein
MMSAWNCQELRAPLRRIPTPVEYGDSDARDGQQPVNRHSNPSHLAGCDLVRNLACQEQEERMNRVITHWLVHFTNPVQPAARACWAGNAGSD